MVPDRFLVRCWNWVMSPTISFASGLWEINVNHVKTDKLLAILFTMITPALIVLIHWSWDGSGPSALPLKFRQVAQSVLELLPEGAAPPALVLLRLGNFNSRVSLKVLGRRVSATALLWRRVSVYLVAQQLHATPSSLCRLLWRGVS